MRFIKGRVCALVDLEDRIKVRYVLWEGGRATRLHDKQ